MDDPRTCPTCGVSGERGARYCAVDGTALVTAQTLVASRYRLGPIIGSGGLGVVHEAFDERMQRRVALKLLRDTAPESTVRLLAEARTIMRLSHPNIVSVQDAGTLPDGGAYLALDWVEGGSLRDILAQRSDPLDPRDALHVATAIASALEAAHDRGVLHRDVTPNNVLIPRRAGADVFVDAKLADFGVHGLLDERSPDGEMTTRAGPVVGTPRYMAPEQFLGARNTAATDLFGLGIVLFEMLYHRLPFGESIESILVSRLRAPIAIPDDPALPRALTTLLMQLLDREPQNRPQSAGAVLVSLRNISIDMDVHGGLRAPLRVGPPISFKPVTPPPPPVRQRPQSGPPRVASTRAILASLFVLALFVAAVIIVRSISVDALGSGEQLWSVPPVWRSFAQGLVVIGVGGLIFALVSRFIAHRREALATQSADLSQSVDSALLGTMPLDRDGISQTIVTTVEEIIQRCRSLDERLIGQTIVAIAHEYASDASTPDSRMEALVQIPQQIERLSARIAARSTPWYVRHEKLLAAAVSGTTVLGGLTKTVLDLMAAIGGKPPVSH